MLKFKEYLKENIEYDGEPIGSPIEINTDSELARSHMNKANEDLNAVTANAFVNSALFVNAVRGTLERYGILLPAESNIQQLSMEGERVYALMNKNGSLDANGEKLPYHQDLFVYMVHNLDSSGHVEGYAQIVNQDELDELQTNVGFHDEDYDDDDDEFAHEPSEWMKYPKARRDDDSGNDNEYA